MEIPSSAVESSGASVIAAYWQLGCFSFAS